MPDKFHDECAVFGIFGHEEAANLTYLGLYALQHRGQEASGIVSGDANQFFVQKGMGLVADIYDRSSLAKLPGHMAIGHNRYSTAGGNDLKNVQPTRKALGRQLAAESWVPADIVIPVPDSGVPAALGYAEGGGIQFETGLIRNHYVGRTFIEPEQSIRHFGVKVKLNAVSEVLSGKRVVVVDDSLVRGTTSRKIVKMIRQAGAKEVHMRISSPPIVSPCFYGIDTPTKKELIASDHSTEEIRKYITADSLAYLSLDGMLKAAPGTPHQYCSACFTERYPIPFTRAEELQLGLFEPAS
ncbi:MAG: hypothetical protein HP492_06740 [Nitrospira sp.]|nr:hypothetical protein [Nitrospira sp.]